MKVEFTINGQSYQRTSNNGIAVMNINLNPGTYQITAKNCYDNNTITNNITVLNTIICSDLTKYYRNDSQFKATILDANGNPQANVNIIININGVFYKRVSNKDGIVNLNINLIPDTYILTIHREDNGFKMGATVKVLPTLFCYNLVKYYKNASQAKAKILDDAGKPLAKTKLTFNINGVFYNATSDDEGVVKLNINLRPGDYILTAERLDNHLKKSSKIKVLPKLIGNDVNTIFEGKKYSVELVDDNGKADGGKLITANINGKILQATTNSEGIATFSCEFLKKGTHTVTATYGENVISNNILVEPGTLTVIKNIGNPYSKKIAYVVGLHPLEHETHETLVKLLPTVSGLNYCYDIYIINVTEDIGHYGYGYSDTNNPGRENGQNIAYKYVYPQILNGGYSLAIDIHSNIGAYTYNTFVFSPVTGGLGDKYARTVARNCPNVNHYQLSRTTSAPYLVTPLNKKGVPAFYFEEYSFATQAQKDSHVMQLIFAVDNLKL